jgi:phosphate transport system protein
MERRFERHLNDLKEKVLNMGSLAECAVSDAARAVFELDLDLAHRVIERETEINTMQLELDETIVRLLALQQLMAADLRFVLAVGRLNATLERIGDQAVNIAEAALRLTQYPHRAPHEVDLPRMAALVEIMVRDALNAFVASNESEAQSVLSRDDDVDELRDQSFRALLAYMMTDASKVFPAFDLILVAKDLERIGDLATNIAEDVIYVVAGRDVRHNVVR